MLAGFRHGEAMGSKTNAALAAFCFWERVFRALQGTVRPALLDVALMQRTFNDFLDKSLLAMGIKHENKKVDFIKKKALALIKYTFQSKAIVDNQT